MAHSNKAGLIIEFMADDCPFCQIAARTRPASIVMEDEQALAFLDARPLFAGHCLLIPKAHVETLSDLPAASLATFFRTAQLLARAVEESLHAEGSFVAINNRVSQSIPHLHVHVVPRRKKDGLRGFFWPRSKYQDEAEMEAVRASIAVQYEILARSQN
jgi:histidine triad (HIT) family protein